MQPNQTQHTVTIGGATVPLRYEMADWAVASKKLKVRLYPFMGTPFWQPFIDQAAREKAAEDAGVEPDRSQNEDYIYENMVILFVGLQSAMPALTWEQLCALVSWEQSAAVLSVVGEAVKDFFQRLGLLPKEEPAATEIPKAPETQSQSETGTSSEPTAALN